MDNQEHENNAGGTPLPPMRSALGKASSPGPEWRTCSGDADTDNKPNQHTSKSGRQFTITVKRIIAHLEKD
jgi:hypothetical protein